jgi:ribosomal protein S18 acetylase RimI-like enzyme
MSTRTADKISIRRCSTADAEPVAALASRLFVESYGPTHPEPELSRYLARSFAVPVIRDFIEEQGATILVAEEGHGEPVGYAHIRPAPQPPAGVPGDRVLEIARFYIDGSRQGRGIGAALMEECFADARSRGADVLWLQVWKEAPWAIGFYKRMGFTVVGSTEFHFGEQQIGQDHVMARKV